MGASVSGPRDLSPSLFDATHAEQAANVHALAGLDLLGQPGIVADLEQHVLPLAYSNPATSVTIGNALTDTVMVTTTQNGNSLLITGAQPLIPDLHQLHPISVTLGPNEIWAGKILSIVNRGNDQTVYLDRGAPVTVEALPAQYLDVGVHLTSADRGKVFWCRGQFTRQHGPVLSAIGEVISRNSFTLPSSFPTSESLSGAWMEVAWGTDNYVALASIFATVSRSMRRDVIVTGDLLATKWPATVTGLYLKGPGSIFIACIAGANSALDATDCSPESQIRQFVIPFDAPPIPPIDRGLSGSDALSGTSGESAPKICFVGASTFTEDSGGMGNATSPVAYIEMAIHAQTGPRKAWAPSLRLAEGAQTALQYADVVTRTGVADWDLSYSTPWVGSATTPGYAYSAAPHIIIFELSANDALNALNYPTIVHLMAMVDSWPDPPSVLWALNANEQKSTIGIDHTWYEHNARFIDTMCKVQGRGVIPFRRIFQMMRDGFDFMSDEMRYQPTTTSGLGAFNTLGGFTQGFTVGTTYSGGPAAFWAEVNNCIAINMAATHDGNDVAPLWMFGYDPTGDFPGGIADTLWVQGNISAALPGMAIPRTCKPTVYGTFSIKAGTNILNYTPAYGGPAAMFTSADNGTIFTIPGAGDTSMTQSLQNLRAYPTNPWNGTPAAPMVGYAQYVSGTEINLFQDRNLTTPLNAVTALASSVQIIFRGSPRKYLTNLSGIAADSSATTKLRIGHRNDEAFVEWMGCQSKAFHTLIIKGGRHNSPLLMAAASPSRSAWTVTQNFNGLNWQDYSVANRTPRLYQPCLLDEHVIGPTGQAQNSGGSTLFGGSIVNHPSSRMAEVWRRTLAQLDLRAP